MNFEVTEIKSLGKGLDKRLSVRLEAIPEFGTNQCGGEQETLYTIHAILPQNSEFSSIQIGEGFIFGIAGTERYKYCGDSACSLQTFHPHEFGKGCRLYDETKPNNG